MPEFYTKLKEIAHEENEHVNEHLDVRAASSVRICQGVSALVFLIFVIYELVYAYYNAGFDIRPTYLIPVAIVVGIGPASSALLKHGYYEPLGKCLLIVMHVFMIVLAFWLDCFSDVSLCIVYVPLFIAIGPVMLLRSIRTELFINTAALLGYFIAAAFNLTPIEPSHAVMTGLVAYMFSLFSLITVSFMRYTIAATSHELVSEIESRKKVEELSAIAAALSYDYLNVYSINLERNEVRAIKLDGYNTKGVDFGKNPVVCYSNFADLYIKDRVHPDDKAHMTEALSLERIKQELAKSDTYIDSYRILDSQGEVHYYQFRYIRIEQTGEVIAGFRCVDVTMRYEQNQRLALQEALNAAQRANVAKTTFLNSVSHDIRTPMNAITGYASRAASNINKPEVVQDALDHIDTASRQLMGYVDSILDVTDQLSNRLGFITTEFSLSELMDETAAKFASQIAEKHIDFTKNFCHIVDDNVKADRARLSRVLYVLLENAVAYTPKGGSILFGVFQSNRVSSERARFVFEVKDTGAGIPPNVLENIFDPFAHERKDTSDTEHSVALGLPLVKTMVEASGGSIHIKSEESKGTDVVVLLPLGVPLLTEDKAHFDGAANSTLAATLSSGSQDENRYLGAHILVVDDNALNRELACDLLSDYGFLCDTAQTGAEAVAKFSESMPGYYLAVLMDILMPDMDGMQATAAIRKLARTDAKTVNIVALSANMESVDSERAMAAGMNAFLNKPFQVEQFLRTLK